MPTCVALALALGLAGTMGDLVASAVKRQSGVKDFGSWVPVHGGLLDVFDSFIFAAPLWYLLLSVVP